MKKILSIFSFLPLLILVSCASNGNVDNGQVKLQISQPLVLDAYETTNVGDGVFHDANYIARNMKIGLNLGNTMEAYEATNCEKVFFNWIPDLGQSAQKYETRWGAPITTQKMIDGIKEAGFNTVRIPVFWGNMMENNGKWEINPEYLNRVREIVDYCFNDDLYVIVNIHHFDEFVIRRYSLRDCKTIFTNLWTQIASYFANYSEKLIFEGFNEYLGGQQFDENGQLAELARDDAFELVNTLNQTFVDAVRATGGNNAQRILIASGYWTNIDLTSSEDFFVPVDSAENKIMVSVHYVDNSMYWEKKIGTERWVYYISDQCEKLKHAFTDKGIPVFLGETTSIYPDSNISSEAKDEFKNSSGCLKYVLDQLLDYRFVPVLWDTHNSQSFYSRNDAKIRNDSDQTAITEALKFFER